MLSAAIPEILPLNLVTDEQWANRSDWFDMDFERLKHEAQQLNHSAIGRQILDCLRIACPVEDRAGIHYYKFPEHSPLIKNDPDRLAYIKFQWQTEEDSHAAFDNLVVDFAEGRQITGRHERNSKAEARVNKRRVILDKFVLSMANVVPNVYDAAVAGTIWENENEAGFLYIVLERMARQIGLDYLADGLHHPRIEEPKHGKEAEKDFKRDLEEHKHIRPIVRQIMKNKTSIVGADILTKAEQQILATTLFDMNIEENRKYMVGHDNRFEQAPGMKGIRPFEATYKAATAA